MKRSDIGWLLVCVALIYGAVAGTRYRFSHPEMTETQLTLHILDALEWQE